MGSRRRPCASSKTYPLPCWPICLRSAADLFGVQGRAAQLEQIAPAPVGAAEHHGDRSRADRCRYAGRRASQSPKNAGKRSRGAGARSGGERRQGGSSRTGALASPDAAHRALVRGEPGRQIVRSRPRPETPADALPRRDDWPLPARFFRTRTDHETQQGSNFTRSTSRRRMTSLCAELPLTTLSGHSSSRVDVEESCRPTVAAQRQDLTQVRRCRWDPESGPVRAFIFLAPTHVGPTNRGLLRRGGVKRQPAFSARRANPTCQAFTGSQA